MIIKLTLLARLLLKWSSQNSMKILDKIALGFLVVSLILQIVLMVAVPTIPGVIWLGVSVLAILISVRNIWLSVKCSALKSDLDYTAADRLSIANTLERTAQELERLKLKVDEKYQELSVLKQKHSRTSQNRVGGKFAKKEVIMPSIPFRCVRGDFSCPYVDTMSATIDMDCSVCKHGIL